MRQKSGSGRHGPCSTLASDLFKGMEGAEAHGREEFGALVALNLL